MRHIAVIVLFIVLALIMTRPLCLHMGTQLPGSPGDSYMGAYIIGWICQSIDNGLKDYWHCDFFWPQRNVLASMDNILAIALMGYPLHFFTENYILIHNILLLFGYFMNGIVMYFIMYKFTRNMTGAIAAGVIFSFNPYLMNQTVHVHLVHAWGFPLTLYLVYEYLKNHKHRYLFYSSVAFLFTFLCNGHYAAYLTLVLPIWGVYFMVRFRSCDLIPLIVIAGIVILICISPILLKYQSLPHKRGIGTVNYFSPNPAGYVSVCSFNYLYGKLLDNRVAEWVYSKWQVRRLTPKLFTGFIPLILCIIGFSRTPHKWLFLGLLLFMLSLSFGPQFFGTISMPYMWLYKLPGFKYIRVTSRVWAIFMMFLGILGAYGLARVWNWNRVMAVVILGLLLFEYHVVKIPTRWTTRDGKVPAEYLAINELEDGPIVYLPWKGLPARQIYYSLYHDKPLLNGYASFVPRWVKQMAKQLVACDTPECEEELLSRYGVNHVIRRTK